jgi:DNA (cytosine-5)-methyltransferase 1
MPRNSKLNVLSLFSSAGIGELGLKACGMNILLSNELIKERCDLYKENYKDTISICGDIWEQKDTIINTWNSMNIGSPFLIYATPPCQGMSFNGLGKLLYEIRAGRRPKEDPRNRLIIPTIHIIKKLKPKWVLLENVPTMLNTIIRKDEGGYKNIMDYLKEELGPDYEGKAEVVNCADYGIPQTRTRLITIL